MMMVVVVMMAVVMMMMMATVSEYNDLEKDLCDKLNGLYVKSHCYFVSEEETTWEKSFENCAESSQNHIHKADAARIYDTGTAWKALLSFLLGKVSCWVD